VYRLRLWGWGSAVAFSTHGKSSSVYHDGKTIYDGLPNPFGGGRYHSLMVTGVEKAPDLEISARMSDGLIMGLRLRRHPVEGVQFHPESIMTDAGHKLLKNFLGLRCGA